MDVKDIIKDSVKIGKVADDYGLPDLGDCPTGHESRGHKCFGINRKDGFFNCFNCGANGDVIGLVMLMEKTDFKGGLKWLAGKYRPDLLARIDQAREPSPEERERYEKGSLYELVFQYGKNLLYEDNRAVSVLSYLMNQRGYSLDNLKKTDWIYFPRKEEIVRYLLSVHPEADERLKNRITALNLTGAHGDGFSRLAFPYRDRRGVITGFIFRATEPKPDGSRYDSTLGTTKADLFNLHACKGKTDLLMVEGYPDALYFPTLGLDSTVAVGQGAFSRGYIEGLQSLKVRSVTIAFDNDPETRAGTKNTEKAVEILKETGIKAYVLDPPLMSPHKDPDEYVKGEGVESFKALVDRAVTGAAWKTARILSRHDLTTDKGQNDALDEAIEYIGSLTDGTEIRKCEGIVRTTLEIPEDELSDRIRDYATRKKEEELKKGYLSLAKDLNDLASSGKPVQEIQTLLAGKTLELRGKAGARSIEPYTFDALVEDIRKTPEGLKTGYAALDNDILIKPGTLTVIAGRPKHGKTTLMMNLLLNMVREEGNEGKAFFFFSYEEQRRRIAVKLITIMAREIIDRDQNTVMVERYIKGGNRGRERIDRAALDYSRYAEDGRIFIIDNPYNITDLANTLTALTQRHDVGAVFIDYIQKIKSTERAPTRQVELQRVSATLLETSINLSIPIIMGAQANREAIDKDSLTMDKLREAGDIEQDANIILGVWNEALSGTPQMGEKVGFHIKVLTNRDGRTFEAPFIFHRPVLKILPGE